jgi:predicted nucleic acid-binding protein
MRRYVVDASVAVKWFVPEIHSAEALRLLVNALQGTSLAASILWVEGVP